MQKSQKNIFAIIYFKWKKIQLLMNAAYCPQPTFLCLITWNILILLTCQRGLRYTVTSRKTTPTGLLPMNLKLLNVSPVIVFICVKILPTYKCNKLPVHISSTTIVSNPYWYYCIPAGVRGVLCRLLKYIINKKHTLFQDGKQIGVLCPLSLLQRIYIKRSPSSCYCCPKLVQEKFPR